MKPKFIQSATRFSLGVLSIGILAACGGGGDASIGIADGGIRGTGSSVGPVSGFGSVFVNGVRFDTSNLNGKVQGDDGIGAEADLDEGMILRVDGDWGTDGQGSATGIEYDDTLRGAITVDQAWDRVSQTAVISIQGLVVNIDRQTVIKGVALPDNLTNGDVVRVSGWRLANGEFRASLVRVQAGTAFDMDNDIELEGQAMNYAASPCRFEIGSVLVRCDDPNIVFETLTEADLSDSPFIEVEGGLFNGDLNATQIRPDDQRRYRRGSADEIELSGPVTEDFSAATDSFSINGITVNITAETEFDDGLTEQDLVSGLLVQVEGDYLSDGVTINADEIELREANAEVDGPIEEAFEPATGLLTVGGVEVKVTSLTLLESDDDSLERKEQLLQSLAVGVEIEVEGIEREDNTGIYLEALKIEIDDDQIEDDEVPSFELVGKLRRLDSNSLSILGVNMSATNSTEFDGVTRAELQQLILPLQNQYPIVEIEYEKQFGGLPYKADKVELEEENDD